MGRSMGSRWAARLRSVPHAHRDPLNSCLPSNSRVGDKRVTTVCPANTSRHAHEHNSSPPCRESLPWRTSRVLAPSSHSGSNPSSLAWRPRTPAGVRPSKARAAAALPQRWPLRGDARRKPCRSCAGTLYRCAPTDDTDDSDPRLDPPWRANAADGCAP